MTCSRLKSQQNLRAPIYPHNSAYRMSATGDLDSLCDALIAGVDSVDVDQSQVPALVARLRLRKSAILRGPESSGFDYDALQRIDDVIAQLMSSNEDLLYSDVQREELRRLKDRRNVARQQLAESAEQLESFRRVFNEKRRQDADRLAEIQRRELEELDQRYSGDPPRNYRKLSAELVQLRQHERALRLTGRYLEAKSVRTDADALEAFEGEQGRMRWARDGYAARQALEKRHKQQMDCLNEKWDRQWLSIEPDSIRRQQHCLKVIETNERRIAEVRGSKNDFRGTTTRAILRARRERLPHLTGRPTSRMGTQRSQRAQTSAARRGVATAPGRARTAIH